jgi:hypothetical protein
MKLSFIDSGLLYTCALYIQVYNKYTIYELEKMKMSFIDSGLLCIAESGI